jgi:hypothetical protein
MTGLLSSAPISDIISGAETATRWARDPIGSALEAVQVDGQSLDAFLRVPGQILREIEDLYRGPNSPQATTIGNSHAYVISAGWGTGADGAVVPLGFVSQIVESSSMTATDVFCVGADANGLPSAIIPGIIGARELQLTGVELTKTALYYALGCLDLTVLSKAAIPLRLHIAQSVDGRLKLHPRTYAGCLVTGYSRTTSADGDRIVKTNLSVRWLSTQVG